MKQRSKRDSLNINVRVCEPGSTQPCGHIIDLSMNGLSISGRGTPLPVELSTLQLLLPWPMHGFEQITLQVEQRWLEFTDAGRWHAGYQILHYPENSLPIMDYLSASFADH